MVLDSAEEREGVWEVGEEVGRECCEGVGVGVGWWYWEWERHGGVEREVRVEWNAKKPSMVFMTCSLGCVEEDIYGTYPDAAMLLDYLVLPASSRFLGTLVCKVPDLD